MALSRELRAKIRAKLKEKSTWAGLGMLLVVAGVPVPPGTLEQVALAIGGAIGVYEIFRKEEKAGTFQ